MRSVFEGWTVLNKHGAVVRYEFGHGLQHVVHPTKKEAFTTARKLAEREDELTCGDVNRWELGKMRFAQVRRMGYRIVRASVMVKA